VASLKEMCNLEQELEVAKTGLVNKTDFNLFDQFSIFDPCRRGVIGLNDIREGLSAIGVYPTGEEIELFMTRYEKNGDRRLNFN
jgi:Ca2+-binding EF-hand superfamily protein